jgi:hypothetical protein
MTKQVLGAVLLTVLLLMFTPGVTYAQENACAYFYCTAYATYSSGSVSGYVSYFDYDLGFYLYATAYIETR